MYIFFHFKVRVTSQDRRGLFPFHKQAMPFLTVDVIIDNQAFQKGRCYICFSSGLHKVETGYNLLMQ